MGNQFGITTGANAGDGSTPTTPDVAENTTAQNSPLAFSSVIDNSFRNALSTADQLNAQKSAVQKPDNSNVFSMGGNLVAGVGGGLWDQATGFFKKSKTQLAREADYGGIAALANGNSVSGHAFKTAGEVVQAAPALNPLTAQGRQNWSTLGSKWSEGWNGTWDEKFRYAGVNLSYGLTMLGGGANTAKSGVNVANDLRAGTMARTLGMGENVITATGSLTDDILLRGGATVRPGVVVAKDATTMTGRATTALENLTAGTRTMFSDLTNGGRTATTEVTTAVAKPGHQFMSPVAQNPNIFQRGWNFVKDAKAGTFNVGESGLAAESNTISRLTQNFFDVKPSTISSESITAAGRMKAGTAAEEFLTGLTVKEGASYQQIKAATEAVIAQGTPRAQTEFMNVLRNAGFKSDDLVAQGNQFLAKLNQNALLERYALQANSSKAIAGEMSSTISTLSGAFEKGSAQAKALKEIDTLAQGVASGINKTDDLVRAVDAFKKQAGNLDPQMSRLLDDLVIDSSRLEANFAGRSLTVGVENSMKTLGDEVDKFAQIVRAESSKFPTGSGTLETPRELVSKVGRIADDLSRGASSPEQLAKAIDDLAAHGIDSTVIKNLKDAAAPVIEQANLTRLMSHVDEAVAPVRQLTGELDNVVAAVRTTNPEQAANLQKAITDFVAGRTGNADELTAAFKSFTKGEVDDVLRTVNATNPEHAARMQQVVADFVAKPGGKADDLTAALKAATNDGALSGQIDDLVRAVTKDQAVNSQVAKLVESVNTARPMMTLEKSFADSMHILDDAATRFPSGAKATAVAEVRQAFNAALHGNASADDLMQAITRNRHVLGTEASEKLSVSGAKLVDAAVDTSRSIAIREAERTSTRLVDTLQAARTTVAGSTDDAARAAIKPLDDIEASVAAFKNKSISAEQLSTDLKAATEKLRQAVGGRMVDDISKHVDELTAVAPRAERLAQIESGLNRTRQFTDNVSSITNSMEAAVRQGGQFRAVDDLRSAIRNGTAKEIDDAVAAVSREFPEQSRLVSRLKADAAKISEAGGTPAALRNLDNAVAEFERIAKQSSDEFKLIEQLRAATASAGRNGVGDDLVRVVERNSERIAAIEARMAGNESKNLVAKLTTEGKNLGESATVVRNLNNIEQSSRALTSVIDNLAPKLDDALRQQLRSADDLIRLHADDAGRAAAKKAEIDASIAAAKLDKATARIIESRVNALDSAAQMVAAERAAVGIRNTSKLADDALEASIKANPALNAPIQDFRKALQEFAEKGGSVDPVKAAAMKVADLSTDGAAQRIALKSVQDEVARLNQMADSVATAQKNQIQAFAATVNSPSVNGYNTALNHLANLHQVAPDKLKAAVMDLRETVFDARAARVIREQGFSGNKTISAGAEFKEVAGLVSNKTEFLREAMRYNTAATEPGSKYLVRGLTQDRFARFTNPTLAEEALNRKLMRDLIEFGVSAGFTYMGFKSFYKKAEDALNEELLAPYEIADLMERELAATNSVEQKAIHDDLAKRIAQYIEGKDQAEVVALREKLRQIIAERTSQNAQSQAVWSRSEENLSIGEMIKKKEHENLVQYGNAMGPARGPGALPAQEVVQTIFVPQNQRVRGSANNNAIDEANKRKPATTNFDIAKIKDMSASMAYNQSGLRATPYGTSSQNMLAAYTPGSTKPWQNVVSWNSGRKYTGSEQGGQNVYGNFKQMENNPENDGIGAGGGAVAQVGPIANDPTAALQVASQQTANQDEQQNAATV